MDLTIIFLTNNKVPEEWAKFHLECLKEAAGDYPIITISRKPVDLGTNIIQTEPESSTNLYRQFLKGAKLATTPYVALVEDDTLYTKDHFTIFRPPLDTFAYNMNRWSLFTWGEATYSRKDNKVGAASINPREAVIEALEERFAKYPDNIPLTRHDELGTGGEVDLGVTIRKSKGFFSINPIIQFNHDYFTMNPGDSVERRHKKKMGTVQAYDVPFWGPSKELVKRFK